MRNNADIYLLHTRLLHEHESSGQYCDDPAPVHCSQDWMCDKHAITFPCYLITGKQ